MKFIIFIFFVFYTNYSYSDESRKIISFKEGSLSVPYKWFVEHEDNCIRLSKYAEDDSSYLTVCKYKSDEENEKENYFIINEDGKWEAVNDGIPVLADLNIRSNFTGKSAIVSCRYKDEAGYHIDECFQAEVDLPVNTFFVFTGRGSSSFFKEYKDIYLSFEIN
ncbi:hypothetical protein [Intestinirhabdus alba]|jgi:hypothetical protein|uniref:Uncharacterized protein n=1 Tax=Intestinirhabdus alba TaxID=2899544 RepID=A0A6L6IPW5_9ENTR|nr:hypothetical protein [Intestinirhabdus alba]MTH48549.1 hypothetical protein [Intestinirhabdus alba]